jgi:hypothetical protein
MSEVTGHELEKWNPMPVNRPKLVKNITDTYPNIAEALIVESLQNSIDSSASNVRIVCDSSQRTFIIEDNGNGMTEKAFLQDYHGIAYSSKDHRKTIGFRGFGNKVYVASGEYVFTETKSETFHGSSIWNLEKGFKMTCEPRTLDNNGTIVKITELSQGILEQLSTTQIRTIVQRHYNAKLKNVRVYVNDESTPIPQKQYRLIHHKKVDLQIPKMPEAKLVGYVGYAKDDLSPEDQLVCVSVHGKMIERTLFDCAIPKSLQRERTTGEVSADFLAESETTQRYGFRQTDLKQVAWGEMRKLLNVWLSQIERYEQEEFTQEEKKFLGKIVKTVSDILKQMPELDLGVGRVRSKTGVEADLIATVTEPTEEIIKSEEKPTSEPHQPRGLKSHKGFSMGFIDDPEEKEIVFQSRIFRINRMHPAFIVAKRDKYAREYHVIKCLLNKLIELSPPQNDNIMQTISDLQDRFFRIWANRYI